MKDTYYFSHDMNARHDPNILSMRSEFGSEGYGWYWIIIEMLREQKDFKLKLSKQMCNALAMQMQCTSDAASEFVESCIEEHNLFASDGDYFWSESLIRRMDEYKKKSDKGRKAAEARWNKTSNTNASKRKESSGNASAMHEHTNRNTNKEKESKENKSKEKEQQEEVGVVVVNPFKLFESEGFGTLSELVREDLGDLIDTYSERWVVEAMKAAVRQGKRKLSYISGTLKNWQAEGIDEPWNKEREVSRSAYQGSGGKRKPDIPIITHEQQSSDDVTDEEAERIMQRIRHRRQGGDDP